MSNIIDLVGQRFGRLTVSAKAEAKKAGRTSWICTCDCGATKVVTGKNLKQGNTLSCGCLKAEGTANLKHGRASKSDPTYQSWLNMRQRCRNVNAVNYSHYGARGVDYCEDWESFDVFLADMGDRPNGCSLDRIDPNLGYSPDNCRWATAAEQANNRRNTRLVEYHGQTKTVSEWASDFFTDRKSFAATLARYGYDLYWAACGIHNWPADMEVKPGQKI